jgi:hypothetical protein
MLAQGGYPYQVICLDEGIDVSRDLDAVAGLVFMGGPGNVGEPTGWMLQELELIRAVADKGVSRNNLNRDRSTMHRAGFLPA